MAVDRPQLTEAARRLDSFDPSETVPLPLSNGETWAMPKARIKHFAMLDADGEIRVKTGLKTGNLGFVPLFELLANAVGDNEKLSVYARLAIGLLRSNYRIDDDEIPDLFEFELNDAGDRYPLFDAIDAGLFGTGPKPTPDGSAPPS